MTNIPTQNLPDAIARRIRPAPPLDGEAAPKRALLEHALYWSGLPRLLHVFPCERYLGIPLTKKHWHGEATANRTTIIDWWSEYPESDIGAAPDKSGHFVIRLIGEEGQESLAELEGQFGPILPEFRYTNRHGDHHLWFKGEALSSRDLLGLGIEVIGPGRFVYLPPSLAPEPD
jgi:hypothetical protein